MTCIFGMELASRVADGGHFFRFYISLRLSAGGCVRLVSHVNAKEKRAAASDTRIRTHSRALRACHRDASSHHPSTCVFIHTHRAPRTRAPCAGMLGLLRLYQCDASGLQWRRRSHCARCVRAVEAVAIGAKTTVCAPGKAARHHVLTTALCRLSTGSRGGSACS